MFNWLKRNDDFSREEKESYILMCGNGSTVLFSANKGEDISHRIKMQKERLKQKDITYYFYYNGKLVEKWSKHWGYHDLPTNREDLFYKEGAILCQWYG